MERACGSSPRGPTGHPSSPQGGCLTPRTDWPPQGGQFRAPKQTHGLRAHFCSKAPFLGQRRKGEKAQPPALAPSSLWVWPGTAQPHPQTHPRPPRLGGRLPAGWGRGHRAQRTGMHSVASCSSHTACSPSTSLPGRRTPPLTKWRQKQDTQAAGAMPKATHEMLHRQNFRVRLRQSEDTCLLYICTGKAANQQLNPRDTRKWAGKETYSLVTQLSHWKYIHLLPH